MRNETFRKGLVCVVMVLFIGMGIMPIAGSLSMEKQTLKSNLGDDTTPPVTTISFDPPYPDSDNGWYISHWLGDVENEYASTTTITMNEDKTVQAFFVEKELPGYWSTTEVVSTESTDHGYVSSLMVDGDGTVHVAWHDHTDYGGSGSDSDIFYKYKPSGGSWSTTEVVSTESTGSSEQPSLMVDGDGTVHVAWMDETNYGGSGYDYDIFYKYKPSGGSWSTTEVVSTESTSYSWYPSLMVDGDGTVHVAWEDWTDYGGSGSDPDIFYKYKHSGGSWSTTEVVSTESTSFSEQSSLMVDGDGTVHVAWQDWTDYGGSGSDRDIFYKYKTSPLRANAHGPYYGKPGTPVSFTGSATGGTPPYSWLWDFGDGNASDEQNPTHVYSTPGNYTVILTVTDDSGDSSDDTTWAYIENNPPNAPTITGATSGKVGVEYQYNFSLSDPDNDAMYLRVDWGNGTPGPWQGPYDSDTTVRLNHTWNQKGNFTIRAQAKDIYDAESDWGTLEVTMPKNQDSQSQSSSQQSISQFFFQILGRLLGYR